RDGLRPVIGQSGVTPKTRRRRSRGKLVGNSSRQCAAYLTSKARNRQREISENTEGRMTNDEGSPECSNDERRHRERLLFVIRIFGVRSRFVISSWGRTCTTNW